MRVLDVVDTTGEMLLRIALDRRALWLDRVAAMRYLAARNQRSLVEPLLDLFIKPFPGEIRAAALDALARCGIQEALPILQKLYKLRVVKKDLYPENSTTGVSFPRKLLQGVICWFREGVVTPNYWLDPWPKLLKARGLLGDVTALRDLIILLESEYDSHDGLEGLEALIGQMGGLEAAVAALCKHSPFDTCEDRLLELACHDPEKIVRQWADYQLAVMAPDKYAERSPWYLQNRAYGWIRHTFKEWLAIRAIDDDDIESELLDCFFHPDQSVMAFTTEQDVDLFRPDRLIPFYSWTLPDNMSINYVDFHPTNPLIIVATETMSHTDPGGQVYLIDYENDRARPLLDGAWEVDACWFLENEELRVIFRGQNGEDKYSYSADFRIKNEPQSAADLGITPVYHSFLTWGAEQLQKTGASESFAEWCEEYDDSHLHRMVSALEAWLKGDQKALKKAVENLLSYTQGWR